MRRTGILTAILVLLLSSSCAQATPDRYARVLGRICRLAHTEYARVMQIGKSSQGLPLCAVVITDPHSSASNRARVLFICGQHGDESSSVMAMTHLAEQFSTTDDPTQRAILNRVVIAIVPVANPDGFSRFRRQNGHGADLNRNWVVENQPETQAISRLVAEFRPQIIVDEHEWLDGGPMRRTSVEVADFGDQKHYTLARLVSGIVTARTTEDGVPLGISHYQEQANPSLAHRHFTRAGMCSMLLETTPDLSPEARARVYDSFGKELLLAVAFPPDPRMSACLHGLRNWDRPMAPRLTALLAPETPEANWLYPCAVMSIAFIMVIATMIGRGARRRVEQCEPILLARVRPIAVGITDVMELDRSPREKLGILREYRSRPGDRQDTVRKPAPNSPVLVDPFENRALNRRWDSDIRRRVDSPAPSTAGRRAAPGSLARLA